MMFSFILLKLLPILINQSLSIQHQVKLAENYITTHKIEYNNFIQNKQLFNKALNTHLNLSESEELASKNFGIFIYKNKTLVYWNTQQNLPPDNIDEIKEGQNFISLQNGYYVLDKYSVQDSLISISLLPILSDYFIETEYLQKKFFFTKNALQQVTLSPKPTAYSVNDSNNNPLFYLQNKTTATIPFNNFWIGILVILIILFYYFFCISISLKLDSKNYFVTAFLVFSGLLLAARALTFYFPSILNFRQFSLFDPSVYGSNEINKSLGDLWLNAIIIFSITLYVSKIILSSSIYPLKFSANRKLLGVFFFLLLICTAIILSIQIKSLVTDSKISFDVTDYSTINIFSIIGFLILALLALSWYLLALICSHFIFFKPSHFEFNISSLLYGLLFLSILIGAALVRENKAAEWEKRKAYAEKLIERNDTEGEILFNMALGFTDSTFLTNNFYRFQKPEIAKKLRDSILHSNYTGYLNKYNTRFYIFNEDNKPVYTDDNLTFEEINAALNNNIKPTETPDLYFYENKIGQITYVAKRYIYDTNEYFTGTLFIISQPKRFNNEAIFPELFKQYKENTSINFSKYFTAVYNNGKLVTSQSNYSFPTAFPDSLYGRTKMFKKINGKFDELWYAHNNRSLIIVHKNTSAIGFTTIFSYLFLTLIVLVGIISFIHKLLQSYQQNNSILKLFQFSIRQQIQATIILVSVFSFLIIGIITISIFINRFRLNNQIKLSRTIHILTSEMEQKMIKENVNNDVVQNYDTLLNKNFQILVNEIAEMHGVDVNLYDLHGNLKVASEATVYNQGILSKKMNPLAFYHLQTMHQSEYITEEKTGTLKYLNIYAPIRDESKNTFAFLNIPYFAAQPEINQEISAFLVTLINLNAFIFLMAGLFALYIANRITQSIGYIGNRMKEINLGKQNEPIYWNRNDEIGTLVKEYNKMLNKLEISADNLAKSEREGAWQEMAKQVAHEIKNPLTPMKLSVQYLQKAISTKQPGIENLTQNVAKNLVEQIDHLSKIASGFSQYANIANAQPENFDIHTVINSLINLYSVQENVFIKWQPVLIPVNIYADKTHINRLFTNILTNAIEVENKNLPVNIFIKETIINKKIVIAIQDNGPGISPDIKAKIFTPNFTTKTSGTGLGLAMCKNIVQQLNGKIWFNSNENGTTFFIELPILNE